MEVYIGNQIKISKMRILSSLKVVIEELIQDFTKAQIQGETSNISFRNYFATQFYEIHRIIVDSDFSPKKLKFTIIEEELDKQSELKAKLLFMGSI